MEVVFLPQASATADRTSEAHERWRISGSSRPEWQGIFLIEREWLRDRMAVAASVLRSAFALKPAVPYRRRWPFDYNRDMAMVRIKLLRLAE
jgi:hypothetical protein